MHEKWRGADGDEGFVSLMGVVCLPTTATSAIVRWIEQHELLCHHLRSLRRPRFDRDRRRRRRVSTQCRSPLSAPAAYTVPYHRRYHQGWFEGMKDSLPSLGSSSTGLTSTGGNFPPLFVSRANVIDPFSDAQDLLLAALGK